MDLCSFLLIQSGSCELSIEVASTYYVLVACALGAALLATAVGRGTFRARVDRSATWATQHGFHPTKPEFPPR